MFHKKNDSPLFRSLGEVFCSFIMYFLSWTQICNGIVSTYLHESNTVRLTWYDHKAHDFFTLGIGFLYANRENVTPYRFTVLLGYIWWWELSWSAVVMFCGITCPSFCYLQFKKLWWFNNYLTKDKLKNIVLVPVSYRWQFSWHNIYRTRLD